MRLEFPYFDGRAPNWIPIKDQDTGEEVGYIKSRGVGFGNLGGIEVSLFDNKYQITANRYDECRGFVKGVEAVLGHMTKTHQRSKQATQRLEGRSPTRIPRRMAGHGE